jgi:hypothetical protein
MAAWHSGHRARLWNDRPGLESRLGIRFFRVSIAMLSSLIDLLCIVCVVKKENFF